MPNIIITFAEEGSDPIVVQLPSESAHVLDLFIADQYIENPDGSKIQKYSGKAELFLKHTLDSLILPLIERYTAQISSQTATQLSSLEQQKRELKQNLIRSMAPVILTPSNKS